MPPPQPAPLHLTVNGEPRTVPAGLTAADLLRDLGVLPETVAVERNRNVVRRATLAECRLADGDVIEIVQFVGGG